MTAVVLLAQFKNNSIVFNLPERCKPKRISRFLPQFREQKFALTISPGQPLAEDRQQYDAYPLAPLCPYPSTVFCVSWRVHPVRQWGINEQLKVTIASSSVAAAVLLISARTRALPWHHPHFYKEAKYLKSHQQGHPLH